MKNGLSRFASLLSERPNALKLILMNQLFPFVIPFNRPHGIKLLELIPKERSVCLLPLKKRNWNHLRTIHACGLALVGEFSAGSCLMSLVSPEKYRLIMSHLDVEFTYRAQKDVYACCDLEKNQNNKEQVAKLKNWDGDHPSSMEILLETRIYPKGEEEKQVALVRTRWQLKPWDKVRG